MSDYWTKYWQQGHLTSFGQDFTGNYIGVLKKVWDTFFIEIADNASILDIGTGNGAILDLALQNNSSFDLVGIDSAELTIPKNLGNIQNLQFLQNVKAEELPFDTEHFSAVVSQFGIEYANFSQALPELIRVLQSNGQIQLVMHDLNSSIVKPNKQILKAALALSTSDGPIVHVRRLVNALTKKGRNSVEAETCRQNLNLSISTITNNNHVGLIGTNFPDFLKYLMSGDVDFAAKKKSIKLFEQELKGQIVRLSDLTNAALSNTKYKLCIDTLQKLGISIEQDYMLIEDNMTIARVIRGKKISPQIVAPIIILSAPRAGSTLLFETLSRHPQLHTIGGESHALIEHIPALSTVARGYVSNRLDENDASKDIIDLLHTRFTQAAKDAFGRPLTKQATSFRLLEKTPKNALRVSFFNTVFKDALFIFLVRDPRENISSIMEAWRSKRFITYPNLPNNLGDWSLLLPDGWQSTIGQTLASKATFQWQAANQSILDGLAKVPRERQMILNYESLITQPKASIELILSFAGLNVAAAKTMLQNGLPLSRYTITKPAPNKWHTNASQMAKPVESIASLAQDLNEKLLTNGQKPIDYQIKIHASINSIAVTPQKPSIGKVSRNAPCPCGSLQKYKHCHGQLT